MKKNIFGIAKALSDKVAGRFVPGVTNCNQEEAVSWAKSWSKTFQSQIKKMESAHFQFRKPKK